jgi:hypothetical protein
VKRVLPAALAYFAIVFGVGFLLGMVRVPLLVPRIGVRAAELLEMPLMAVAIVLAARFIVQRFSLPATSRPRLAAGAIALALLLAAELALAVALSGQSVTQYVAGRDPVSGTVYAVMLVVFALMPWVLSSLERTATER